MADGNPLPISTVLFDADGVLQRAGPLHAHFQERYGWPREKLDAFFHHLFHERLYLDQVLLGVGDPRTVLAAALADWGWLAEPERFLADWYEVGIVPDPAALTLVDTLREAGIRCVLASNQDIARAEFMDDQLGYRVRFDQRFYSATVGHAKPDHAYFEAVLGALAEPAGQVLFIDDKAENVNAARQCGLRAEVLHPGGRLADLLAGHRLPVVRPAGRPVGASATS
ncbi:HAD-IA family hydrolase [Natronosporangium hydrolyticum]|uniref:HAD-IA family hydrolase n=1 Tax=Natronosporangium hydrolyticum TaxID=2811111 RepID=A0A895YC74_9ACTN|nr:HAD-IA family hydrolase [Natronosporangium hydrolyticum]QSB13043.1 HAD-IA family hydrolase [Natronosporangium hydrolyticum]